MSFSVDSKDYQSDIRQLLSKQNYLLELLLMQSNTMKAEIVSEDQRATVNKSGELFVTLGQYDLTEFKELAVDNTAYNFYQPQGGEQLIITGFLAYADKQVSSTTNATVIIYEATESDSTTVDRVLLQFEIGQNQSVPLSGIRILCNPGVYINAKTDDDDVHLTIFGHYVSK